MVRSEESYPFDYARITASSTVIIIGNPTNDAPTATAPPVLVAPWAEPERDAVTLPPDGELPLEGALLPVGAAPPGPTEGVTVAAAANRSVEA